LANIPKFAECGCLCGIKTINYYLKCNRAAGAPSGKQNFHIIYYCFAGVAAKERQHVQLLKKTAFQYLGQHGIPGIMTHNGSKLALKNFGFSKHHVAQTCQLIVAIFHLGNLEFTIDRVRDVNAAIIRNQDGLAPVAEFLGVTPSAIEIVLSYKIKLVKKELCTVFLDPDGAANNCDDLMKTLYSLLFSWLNEHINECFC